MLQALANLNKNLSLAFIMLTVRSLISFLNCRARLVIMPEHTKFRICHWSWCHWHKNWWIVMPKALVHNVVWA